MRDTLQTSSADRRAHSRLCSWMEAIRSQYRCGSIMQQDTVHAGPDAAAPAISGEAALGVCSSRVQHSTTA